MIWGDTVDASAWRHPIGISSTPSFMGIERRCVLHILCIFIYTYAYSYAYLYICISLATAGKYRGGNDMVGYGCVLQKVARGTVVAWLSVTYTATHTATHTAVHNARHNAVHPAHILQHRF